MANPIPVVSSEEFVRRYSETLFARAAPLFEEAAASARHGGWSATVHTTGTPPELCLEARAPDQAHPSHYRIMANTAQQDVHHVLFFATDGSTSALDAGLDSINNMVIDTQLAHFFKALGFILPTVERRHPAGFW